jgi:hypothetical protein
MNTWKTWLLMGTFSALLVVGGHLAYGTQTIPMETSPAVSHLYIAQPFSNRGLMNLFITHPPLDE